VSAKTATVSSIVASVAVVASGFAQAAAAAPMPANSTKNLTFMCLRAVEG
jgi:hypothetical protein